MNLKKLSYFLIASSTIFTLLITSCKKSKTEDQAPPATVTGMQLTATATLGNVITDNQGRALYFFSKDAALASTCVGDCNVTWPVFYKENPVIGTGLTAADFAVITRADGSKQNTYKGWPLYYYSGDATKGDTKGDALNNLWAVAKADYTVMFANAQLVGADGTKYNDQGAAGTGISQFVTAANGTTLYMHTPDTKDHNTFTAADFNNNAAWPIYTVPAVASVPTVLDKTKFTIINTYGRNQVSYKGHPLYSFGQDQNVRGSTKGVGLPVWKVTNNATVGL